MATTNPTPAPKATPTAAAPPAGTAPKGAAPVKKPSKKVSITMMAMAIMIVTTVCSLRGLASQAEFGYTSIFWYLFAAIVFLIPFSLVCAELGSTWTKSGGLFRWCAEAFGPKWGWTAMYLEWMTVVIWFPSVLMFGAVSLAYVFWPEAFDAKLADNIVYTIILVLAVYWLSTFNCFRGMRAANKLSTYGGLFGTIIPGAILIILGIIYVCTNGHVEIDTAKPFWPDFSKFGTFVLAASVFLFFGGMEMQGVHIESMKNPAKEFPKSMLIAVIIILAVFIFGTLAIGWCTPAKDINLLASLLTAYNNLWAHLGVPWLGNVMAVFITFGVIGQVSVIIAGPSTGILAVGRSGYLPPSLQKVNKNDIQTHILWVQGIIVTILSFVLVVMPSVETAYQILSQMATIIYLLLCIIIFCAFFRLRKTEPNIKRSYRVPGGKFGKWIVTLVGVVGCSFAAILSFIPPSQIGTGSPAVYVGILIVGVVILAAIPFIVYARRKPSWHQKDADFYPFDWQIEGRLPNKVSKWPEGYVPTAQQIQNAYRLEDLEAEDKAKV